MIFDPHYNLGKQVGPALFSTPFDRWGPRELSGFSRDAHPVVLEVRREHGPLDSLLRNPAASSNGSEATDPNGYKSQAGNKMNKARDKVGLKRQVLRFWRQTVEGSPC